MSVPLEVTLYCYNLPTDQEGPPTLRSVINRYGMLPRPLDIPDEVPPPPHRVPIRLSFFQFRTNPLYTSGPSCTAVPVPMQWVPLTPETADLYIANYGYTPYLGVYSQGLEIWKHQRRQQLERNRLLQLLGHRGLAYV